MARVTTMPGSTTPVGRGSRGKAWVCSSAMLVPRSGGSAVANTATLEGIPLLHYEHGGWSRRAVAPFGELAVISHTQVCESTASSARVGVDRHWNSMKYS